MDHVITHGDREVTFYDLDREDHIEGRLFDGFWYELPNLEYIRDLKVKGNYVDVGAYVGTHALYFALFCGADHVYAFEPHLIAFNKLVKNTRFNAKEKISVSNVALGAAPSTGSMLCKCSTNRGGTFLMPGDDVVVDTLDSFKLEGVKLIKLDVEGSDYGVIIGGRETVAKADHVFMERWTRDACACHNIEYTTEKTEGMLRDMGFRPVRELPIESLWHWAK
jgi:FkbM family methyltransferase